MNAWPAWLDALVALLLLGGGVFCALGSLALLRFGDFMQRLHGPTKATTLGIGCIVLAAMLTAPGLRSVLVSACLLLTAPVSAMMLARAWRARRERDDEA